MFLIGRNLEIGGDRTLISINVQKAGMDFGQSSIIIRTEWSQIDNINFYHKIQTKTLHLCRQKLNIVLSRATLVHEIRQKESSIEEG